MEDWHLIHMSDFMDGKHKSKDIFATMVSIGSSLVRINP
jgi:hypothetical protein